MKIDKTDPQLQPESEIRVFNGNPLNPKIMQFCNFVQTTKTTYLGCMKEWDREGGVNAFCSNRLNRLVS